jgi:DNA-binding CsgD family transcriptional regulator
VTGLAQADVDAILGFVGEAASPDGATPFSAHALGRLRDIARADDIVFSELDRVRQRFIRQTTADDHPPNGIGEPVGVTYWQIRREHPACAYHERTGDFRALRVSDFMSHRQLLRSRVYREWFKPQGIATEMSAGLDAPMSHTKVFLFRRVSGDFSERDRTVVEALRPMLARLYEASLSRQRLATALKLIEDHDTVGAAAVVTLDGAGRPDYVSGPAQALFARMGTAPGHLPAELETRMKARHWADPGDPIVVSWQGAEIVVHRSGDALLFQERSSQSALTAREHEILDLVAAGRTNGQVADLLFISPGTVRRHLENAFWKLGVHTRTAAVARMRTNGFAAPALAKARPPIGLKAGSRSTLGAD